MTFRDSSLGHGPVIVWLWLCAAMIFAMTIIGGITRLTESGLSITEWRPVTGILPPLDEESWVAEFAKYQRIPEFREKNSTMTLAEFKTIFFWEYVHRLWGRLIGIVFSLPFVAFLFSGRVRGALAWRLGFIFLLGGLQGAVGWWMVMSGLVDRVDVSPYRLAIHLGLALIIHVLIVRTALALAADRANAAHDAAGVGAAVVVLFVFVTIIAGAFVAGTDAGRIYNTFPLMDGRLIPAGYHDIDPWWRNAFENVAAVQFHHRVLATATVLSVLVLAVSVSRRRRVPAWTARLAWLTAAAVIGQFALGVVTLLFAVPIALGAAHQAGAVILLTLSVALHHALARPRR
jgi:cytochrome c oxidase assembly protein subunit 15